MAHDYGRIMAELITVRAKVRILCAAQKIKFGMGKLNKLRRKIVENPDKWVSKTVAKTYIKAARIYKRHIYPTPFGNSYKSFVKSVLTELDYTNLE